MERLRRRQESPPPGAATRSQAVVVVRGTIRAPGDAEALPVDLNVCDRTLILRTGDTDLGQWPTHSVTINHAAGNVFDFVAEGDQLVFETADGATLRELGLVDDGRSAPPRKAKRGKARTEKAPKRTRRREREDTAPAPSKLEQRFGRSSAATEPAGAVPGPDPMEPTPKQVDATDEDAQAKPRRTRKRAARLPHSAAEASSIRRTPAASPETSAKKGRRRKRKAEAASPQTADAPATTAPRSADDAANREADSPPRLAGLKASFAQKRHETWIFALDQARRVDLFGLDRVPFKDHMRDDPNHEHTYDHRVAPESGLASRICVICGKIRT